MKTRLEVNIKMHFKCDALLSATFVDSNGQTHVELSPFISSWSADEWGNRKRLNQEVTDYKFVLSNLPEDWEFTPGLSKVEFGWLDRRSCDCFVQDGIVRTVYLDACYAEQ